MKNYNMPFSAVEISKRIHAIADPVRAIGTARFFKTGPGEYGEGDKFAGVTTPQMRAIVKEVAKDTPESEIEKLLKSGWHEERAAGLHIWVKQFAKTDDKRREEIYNAYLANTAAINNWDLVDCTAPFVIGPWLEKRSREPLYKLVKSSNLWERRIAILSTLHFIRKNDFADTLRLAELLLTDKEDLMHKATGWMLREVGKRSEATLCGFLDKHAATMPRTALRYAIERMPKDRRQDYMDGGCQHPVHKKSAEATERHKHEG